MAAKKDDRRAFLTYIDHADFLEELEPESFKKVVLAIYKAASDENFDCPEGFNVTERLVFKTIARDVKNAIDHYNETSKKKSEGGKKGMAKRWGKDEKTDAEDPDCVAAKNDNLVNLAISNITELECPIANITNNSNSNSNNDSGNTNTNNKRARANAQAHLDQLAKLYPLEVNWSQVSANAKRELLNVSPDQMKNCVNNYERWREAQTTRDFSPRYKSATTWFERAWKDYIEYKPPANANTGGKRSQRYVSAEGPRDFSYAEAVSEVPPEIWKTLTDEQRKEWIANYHGQAWTGEASPPYAVAN